MPGTSTTGAPVENRNSSGTEVFTSSAPGEVRAGRSVSVSTSFTRPADTTAYAAGDAVTNSTSSPVVMTFANCARYSGGGGVISSVGMLDSASVATKGSFELWLFTVAPTPDNDNAVFTPTDAELASCVGVYPLITNYVGDATAGAGGNAVYESAEKLRPFVCATTSLFGLLVVRNAYVPVSAEVFTLFLEILQD
jgi:hypothetical protein